MVSSINTSNQLPPISSQQSTQNNQPALTSDQLTSIDEILSNFSAEELSAADAISIVEQFSEAGIEPSSELASVLESNGFSAKEIGDAARAEGGAPPPPPQADITDSDEIVNFLEEILEGYDEQLSDEDKDAILTSVQERFGTSSNALIDITA